MFIGEQPKSKENTDFNKLNNQWLNETVESLTNMALFHKLVMGQLGDNFFYQKTEKGKQKLHAADILYSAKLEENCWYDSVPL